VWVNARQRADIAELLGIEADTVIEDYTHKVGNRYSLIEKSNGEDLDCIFLDTRGGKRTCSIYEARPTQCRTWPFWTENLTSHGAWDDAGVTCPGINNGTHYDFVEIEIQRSRKR
jgi:Fe-S-cluster containining protein